MRLLILSDSHHSMGFMEECVAKLKPDCVFHLGDYYPDGFDLKQMFPGIPFYQVPGNCDSYTCREDLPQILMPRLEGLNIYMTHGHKHYVKSTLASLLRDARECHGDIVLYGHTHQPDCHYESDGILVMNPGTAAFLGSAGLIEIEKGKILNCRILRGSDLEAMA